MDDLQQKLSGILSDPAAMEQLQSMAQALGMGKEPAAAQAGGVPTAGGVDPAVLTAVSSLAGQTAISREEQALLGALRPFLASDRLSRLERAMRAARLAAAASAFFGGSPILSGR